MSTLGRDKDESARRSREAGDEKAKSNGKDHVDVDGDVDVDVDDVDIDDWPMLEETAYLGLAGEVVETIAPHSEADPVAILIQFLAAAGNIIGRRGFYQVESDRHHANLFAVLVGPRRARLTRTDAANGFANRFLFPLVRRSKELPFGGDLTDSEIVMLGERLKEVVGRLPEFHRVTMTDEARRLWAGIYSKLSADKPGMLGAVTARAEAQTVRLALIYTLLDGELRIDQPHLSAGLAVWKYCEASAKHIFGKATGDPVVDEIARALSADPAGLTRNAIRDLFSRHQSSERIGAALADLLMRGVARCETRSTGGRPVETWFSCAESAESAESANGR